MYIIGLHGEAGAGKDTVAGILKNNLPEGTTKLFGFADGVKRVAMVKFGLTQAQVFTHEGKQETIESLGCTVRELLELEGTEATRDIYGHDFWVWRLTQDLEQAAKQGVKVALITDVRFENEAQFIKGMGGAVIRVDRELEKQTATVTHRSAQPLDESLIDIVVENNGTIEELEEVVHQLADVIKEELI